MLRSEKLHISLKRHWTETTYRLPYMTDLLIHLRATLEPMHRYMAIRKRVLKVKELHMYDLYTPLTADPYKDISWTDAKGMMYEALAPLGEKIYRTDKKGTDEGWADVFPNKGKTERCIFLGQLCDTSLHIYELQ